MPMFHSFLILFLFGKQGDKAKLVGHSFFEKTIDASRRVQNLSPPMATQYPNLASTSADASRGSSPFFEK